VTSGANAVQLRILGPLEASIGGEAVTLGGAKQRAVLAALLLRAGEVVSVERLVEEVWGDEPPPSAAHTLESYVSRLRQLFNGHGPRVLRRGSGYLLELAGAELDARTFVELYEQGCLAASEEDHERVVRLTAAALAVWRGPALADVALASAGRAEAERLEELRLRTHEVRFDAQLALGRHEHVIGELQPLVGQNPYRERFVAQLMLALYRSGRHADALSVYERLRASLDEDLGLQPSADIQRLSGQIVRQDPELRNPVPPRSRALILTARTEQRRGRSLILAIVSTVAVLAVTVTASGGAAASDRVPSMPDRLALVLPGPKNALSEAAQSVSRGVSSAASAKDLDLQTLFVDERDPAASVHRAIRRIEQRRSGIVIAMDDGSTSQALAAVAPAFPDIRFVFVDASRLTLGLKRAPNVTAIRFVDEDTNYLAGYLSGITPPRDGSRPAADVVSVVGGEPSADTQRLIGGFERGLRRSGSRAELRIAYSHSLDDPTACERIANRQIDAGSDVVFAVSGRCSLGALEVAAIRGVWGVGAGDDGVEIDSHMLVVTHKEWERTAFDVVQRLVNGGFPAGEQLLLGLEDDYAAGLEFSYYVPQKVESLTIERCSEIRATKHRDF
jgi:DNA-binding SARP family transcriptional activator/basic membrane lipoprotein Med (substrate-binding protein (PBP1-ABC) superfamily)